MASYTRVGSFLLADELAQVPYGRIHRALTLSGRALERHYLLFTFTDELLGAGLGSKWPEAQKAAALLAGVRGFGTGYRFDPAKPAHMACDYLPGRSLAQVLDKVREEQIPLGVEHALVVLQGLAQALVVLHDKGLRHGALSPASAWITYEGATQILDAPVGGVFQALLPKAPVLKAALEPYRSPVPANLLQQDLYGLGAVFYEMLTLEQLPAAANIPEALAQATLRAAQEEAPVPEEIMAFLKRLLMVGQPFGSAPEFNAALERVLYDGEYSPTTFNMAFLMHTLFREENELDSVALKNDQGADFSAYLPPETSAPAAARPPKGSNRPVYILLGGIAVLLVAGLGFMYWRMQVSDRLHQIEVKSTQARLEAYLRDKQAAEAKVAELTKQEEAQKTLEDLFGKQVEEATTTEARAAAKRDLESAKQRRADLARQKAEALAQKQKLAQPGQAPEGQTPAGGQAPAAQPAAGAPPADLDAQPAVAQMGSAQIPKGGARALPPSLQQSEIKVSLRVFVDATGKPQKVVILQGVEGNYGYNDSAQNAALASTFTPGRKNGKPTAGWLTMEINFGKPQ
jgi:hypothetical protein